MKRWNFGGLRATHGVSSRTARSVRPAAARIPARPSRTRRCRPSRRRSGDHAESRSVQTDVERGLIMVEGRGARAARAAGCGARRGQEARCRRKRRCPASSVPRPTPAAPPKGRRKASGPSPPSGGGDMNSKVTIARRQGRRLGSNCPTRFSASSRAPTSWQRCVNWQLAKRRAGTHKVQGRADITAPARRCTSRRAPAAPATARRACRSSAAAAGVRPGGAQPREFDLPKKVRALALRTRCRPRPRTAADRHRATPKPKEAKTKALRSASPSSAVERADHRRRRVDANFALAARNIPHVDVLPSPASTSTTSCAATSWC
jgi:ribosomal protein L4